MSEVRSRAVRALFRMRGVVGGASDAPVDVVLERLAACARVATGAHSATVLRGDGPRATEPHLLDIPLTGAQGERAGYLRLDLQGLPRLQHLEIEVANLCAAKASAALAEQAARVERERAERRSDAVHAIVSASVQHLDLGDMLHDAVDALRRGIRCQGVWVRAFDSPHSTALRRFAASYPDWGDSIASDELLAIAGGAARRCWERQCVSVLDLDEPDVDPLTTTAERDFMFDFMRSARVQHLLMGPLGGAGECQGFIALIRSAADEPFDAADEVAVLTIGRELGAAVVHARLYEQERSLVRQLRALDAYKDRFVATVAHQLKSPLTSIVGHTEVLHDAVEGPGLDPDLGLTSIETIRRSADRIRETVDALLTLSEVQDPERPLVSGQVPLGGVVQEVCDLLSVAAHERAITLDLGSVDPRVQAWGDRVELEKVVDNLVGNAVKYSPEGSRVQLAVVSDGDAAVFECRDHGFGMQPDDLARLFEPFHRSTDPRMLAVPGTGLGMAIVKAVVDRHQGHIDVESTPDVGSVFRVRLPAAPEVA